MFMENGYPNSQSDLTSGITRDAGVPCNRQPTGVLNTAQMGVSPKIHWFMIMLPFDPVTDRVLFCQDVKEMVCPPFFPDLQLFQTFGQSICQSRFFVDEKNADNPFGQKQSHQKATAAAHTTKVSNSQTIENNDAEVQTKKLKLVI